MGFIKVTAIEINGPRTGKAPERIEILINTVYIKAIIGRTVQTTEDEPLQITIGKKTYSGFEFVEFVN
ncbi:hypothetical protein ACWKW6_22885 [Dyadobacter jiangsuensis]|uniref:hypothetical protein n=1 Tax=Dyadobacter sp. TaxID=1914288 RepID=UPI003F71358F